MEVVLSDSHDLVREWLDTEGVGANGYNPDAHPTTVRGDHRDGTGIWCALYADQDYIQHWLLEVHTYRPSGDTSVTVVDYLYAVRHPDGIDTEWFNEPRLFFDRGVDYQADGFRWFVERVEAFWEAESEKRTPVTGHRRSDQQVAAYNEGIRQKCRDQAAAIGIVLPNHGTPTNYSRRKR